MELFYLLAIILSDKVSTISFFFIITITVSTFIKVHQISREGKTKIVGYKKLHLPAIFLLLVKSFMVLTAFTGTIAISLHMAIIYHNVVSSHTFLEIISVCISILFAYLYKALYTTPILIGIAYFHLVRNIKVTAFRKNIADIALPISYICIIAVIGLRNDTRLDNNLMELYNMTAAYALISALLALYGYHKHFKDYKVYQRSKIIINNALPMHIILSRNLSTLNKVIRRSLSVGKG